MTEALFTQFAALLAAALLIPSSIFLAYGLNHRNMSFWWIAAISYFLIFFGSTLVAARSFLPDLAVIFLSNALIGVGYVLCLRSVRMVKACWKFYQADVVLTGAYLTGFVITISLYNIYPARVALFSTFVVAISITTLMTVFFCATRTSRLGDTALLVFASGNTIFSSLRGITALFAWDEYLLSFDFWDQAFFIWSIAAVFCFAIGLFLNGTALIGDETRRALEKERLLTVALTEALEGQRNLQKLILHELKRPLNSVLTAVELSRHGQAGMSPDEVERVHQLTCLANDYMRGIGDYEDIHALFDSPTLTEARVAGLVEDIRNKWQVAIHAPDAAGDASLPVDLLLFDIAIGNLIENARKFGQTADSIGLAVHVDTGGVSFDVTDDGPGIPAAEAEKVFRQFYKINSTQTNAIKGCGLGLYIVRRIAEAHGGTCKVLSQRPSTLRLTLPRPGPLGKTA